MEKQKEKDSLEENKFILPKEPENQKIQQKHIGKSNFLPNLFKMLNASIANLIFGYNLAYFNMVEGEIISLNKITTQKDLQVGITNFLLAIGAIIGSLIAGKIGIGRRKSLILFNIIAMVGTCLLLTGSIHIFMIGRLINGKYCFINLSIGIALGIGNTNASIQVVEMSPVQYSGFFGAIPGCMVGVGLCFASGISIPMTMKIPNYWRIVTAFPILFQLLNIALHMFKQNMDTPIYFMLSNKKNEAIESAKDIYGANYSEELFNKNQAHIKAEPETPINVLFGQRYLRRTLITCVLGMLCSLSGITAINYYSKRIILGTDRKTVSVDDERYAIIFSFLVNLVQPLSLFIVGPILNKYGRKISLVIGEIIIIISLALFSLFSYLKLNSGFLLFGFMLGFMISVGTIFWLQIAEVGLPASGTSLAILVFYVVSSGISLLFPMLQQVFKNVGIFLFFMVCDVVCLIFGIVFMVETKGKTKEEIEELFCPLDKKKL